MIRQGEDCSPVCALEMNKSRSVLLFIPPHHDKKADWGLSKGMQPSGTTVVQYAVFCPFPRRNWAAKRKVWIIFLDSSSVFVVAISSHVYFLRHPGYLQRQGINISWQVLTGYEIDTRIIHTSSVLLTRLNINIVSLRSDVNRDLTKAFIVSYNTREHPLSELDLYKS